MTFDFKTLPRSLHSPPFNPQVPHITTLHANRACFVALMHRRDGLQGAVEVRVPDILHHFWIWFFDHSTCVWQVSLAVLSCRSEPFAGYVRYRRGPEGLKIEKRVVMGNFSLTPVEAFMVGAVSLMPLGEVVLTFCQSYNTVCHWYVIGQQEPPWTRKVQITDKNPKLPRFITIFRTHLLYAAPPLVVKRLGPDALCFEVWTCFHERESMEGTLSWGCNGDAVGHFQSVSVLPFWQATRVCSRDSVPKECQWVNVRWEMPQCAAPTNIRRLWTQQSRYPGMYVGAQWCSSSLCDDASP